MDQGKTKQTNTNDVYLQENAHKIDSPLHNNDYEGGFFLFAQCWILTGIPQWGDTTDLSLMDPVLVMNVDGASASEKRSETDRGWTSP